MPSIPASETKTTPEDVSTGPREDQDEPGPGLTTVVVETSGPAPRVVPDSSTTVVPDPDTGSMITTSVLLGPVADSADGAATGADSSTDPRVRYSLTVPAGTTSDLGIDQTVALVGPDGPLVAGFAAPVVTDAAGVPVRASWAVQPISTAEGTPGADPSGAAPSGTTTLDVDLRLPADAAYPVTISVHLGASVVASTAWGDNEGGTSLAVTPSGWGRVAGMAGQTSGWADLVEAEPSADSAVMEKQLRCHQIGAPDKGTWNLEPWRPDVSFLEYVAARCNPV